MKTDAIVDSLAHAAQALLRPGTIAPDGLPYSLRLPAVTLADAVRAQAMLVEALEIESIVAESIRTCRTTHDLGGSLTTSEVGDFVARAIASGSGASGTGASGSGAAARPAAFVS